MKSQFIWKYPDAGNDWRQEKKGVIGGDGWMATTDMSLNKLQEMAKGMEAWRAAVHGVTNSQTWLRDWTRTLEAPAGDTEPSPSSYMVATLVLKTLVFRSLRSPPLVSEGTERAVCRSQACNIARNQPCLNQQNEGRLWLRRVSLCNTT